MPRRPEDTGGVFASLERRGSVATKARRQLLVGFGLVAAAMAIGSVAAPQATVLAVQLAIPLTWLGVTAGALFYAIRAVRGLVTGQYRSGRSDFGLPGADDDSSKRHRLRR